MLKNHRRGQHEHQPLDAEREKTRVLQLFIDGSDEDGTRQKARAQRAGNEQDGRPNNAGQVGLECTGQRRSRCIGGIKGRYADDQPQQDAAPKGDSGNQSGGGSGWRPIAVAASVCEALIQSDRGKSMPQ